ncbi:MAG: hypothetical protein AB8B83_06370 [Bdellovibrionales bacterium]
MLKLFSFNILLFSFFIGCVFAPIKQASASDSWDLYVSDSNLFTVLFPGNPDEKLSSFRIGDTVVAQNSETIAFIDQRPYKDIVKTFIVKFDQTLGPSISPKNMAELVDRELSLYEKSYNDRKPQVLEREIENGSKKVIGKLTMTYEDLDKGVQLVQVRVVMTQSSKFHQVFTGLDKDLGSNETIEFFKSFAPKDGYMPKKGSMNEEWRRIESPMSLFAVKIPRVNPPYFINEPSVSKEDDNRQERIGMVFTDPVWSQNLFYNITGYQLETEMSFDMAEKALLEKHLKRHGRSMVGIKLIKDFIGETPYIETMYAIKPPEGFNYVNYARVRAMFLGNYMIVQEVVGPRHLVTSDFTNNFFDLIEFTPKQAFQKAIQRHMGFQGDEQ